jgi:hypothetical protein
VNQAADGAAGLADSPGMDRFVSVLLLFIAFVCLGGAGLMLLGDFVEYLQIGRWRIETLLDTGYAWHLLNAHWFLASNTGALIREGLRVVPTFLALLLVAPVAWWLGNQIGDR